MTDVLVQMKWERRWTLVFLIAALGLAGAIQGWEYAQVHAALPIESASANEVAQ